MHSQPGYDFLLSDSFIRFEKAEKWHLLRDILREQMLDMAADLTRAFDAIVNTPSPG